MFSAKQRYNLCKNTEIQLKSSVLSEIWAKKTRKKCKNHNKNALILPISPMYTGFKLGFSVFPQIL